MSSSRPSSKADVVTLMEPGGPFQTSHWTVRFLYKISCHGISIWYFAMDYLLSRFVSTTTYQQESEGLMYFAFQIFFSFTLVLIFSPMALICFVVWFPLQLVRPRSFSYLSSVTISSDSTKGYKQVPISSLDQFQPVVHTSLSEASLTKHYSFFLASGNVCLMPEFTARINNLSHTVKRAEQIAAYLCNNPVNYTSTKTQKRRDKKSSNLLDPSNCESMDFIDIGLDGNAGDNHSVASTQGSVASKDKVVTELFPESADFICLQEVFDSRAAKALLNGLNEKFPFIIYDVAWPIHNYRMTLLSSGLCIASRFPFLDVQFRAFPHGSRDDKLACKGLLMTKVHISKTSSGVNLVGFLSTTHLQAWSRASASQARCRQLNLIETWMEKFVRTARKMDNEKVLFNIITGDFNFDKVSYYDHNEQTCSFMRNLCDPCIDEMGSLHSWVVGTELNQKKMHDDMVRTPQGLQRMLVSELERHHYVTSTMARRSSLKRAGDGKRKIDYILYKRCDSVGMTVKDYKFFTGLATLSDHIPIGMSFSCQLSDEKKA